MYNDFVNNVRTVKLLNDNNYFVNKINMEGKKCYNENKKYVKYYSFEEVVRNTLIVIPFFLGLIKAVIDLSNGIDTLGIITFYISLQVEMGFVFEELSGTIISWYELKAIKTKLNSIFKNLDNRKKLKTFNEIKLSDIVIKYPKSNLEIKIDNFIINNKDKISITGQSGQGKTSTINLILGNVQSYKGQVFIDNKNLNDVKLDIGVVSQEIELFNMSIKDNLMYGNEKVKFEDVVEVCKKLGIDNKIQTFEKKYDTIVDATTDILSYGEKQLLSYARAILKNGDIVILDEVTSNLDLEFEKYVMQANEVILENKISFVIAHRLNTIKDADLILFIEDTHIVEMGTHEELISLNGKYASLVNS